MLPEFLKDPTIQISAEVAIFKIILCSGADFDFKIEEKVSSY